MSATRKHDPACGAPPNADMRNIPPCERAKGHAGMHGADGYVWREHPTFGMLNAIPEAWEPAPSPSPRSGRTLREEIGALCGLGRVVGPAELAWALDNCPDCASPRSPRATPDRAEVERMLTKVRSASFRDGRFTESNSEARHDARQEAAEARRAARRHRLGGRMTTVLTVVGALALSGLAVMGLWILLCGGRHT